MITAGIIQNMKDALTRADNQGMIIVRASTLALWTDECERLEADRERLINWGHGVIGACEMMRDATRDRNTSVANAAMAIVWNARDLFDKALAEPVKTPDLEIDGAEKCLFRHPNKTWCFHSREYHEGWGHHQFQGEWAAAEPVGRQMDSCCECEWTLRSCEALGRDHCRFCSGEACYQCPDLPHLDGPPCEHDVADRHPEPVDTPE